MRTGLTAAVKGRGFGYMLFPLHGTDSEMLQSSMQAQSGLMQGSKKDRNLSLAVYTASDNVLRVLADKLLLSDTPVVIVIGQSEKRASSSGGLQLAHQGAIHADSYRLIFVLISTASNAQSARVRNTPQLQLLPQWLIL